MVLVAEDVTFSFKDTVLDRVSAEFPSGSITAILGPNGAGKTTLLRLLLGVLRPRQGRVLLHGQNLAGLRPIERAASIAYVPQRAEVSEAYTVRQVVSLGLYAQSDRRDRSRVDAALDEMDILLRAEMVFGALSAGQRQRASVARALAQLGPPLGHGSDRPKVLLADEPTASMDPGHAEQTFELLKRRSRAGLCVVIALHDLSAALRYADRVLLLRDDGRVAAAGDAPDVLRDRILADVFGIGFELVGTGLRAALVPVGRLSEAAGQAPV